MSKAGTVDDRIEDNALWVRRYHPAADSAVRLVCLPHAGGSASFFFPVSAALSPAVDVLAIQYPGRQDRRREPCVDTIDELVDGIFHALRPWLDKPLIIFGHSMGATVGFELVRRLERESAVAAHRLIASGRRAPSCPRDERIHQTEDDELLADVRSLNGTSSALLSDEEVLRMALPAIRSDYRAAETYEYRPGAGLRCPVTALVGDDDPKVTVDEARAWAGHTEGDFELRVFRGGHFYLVDHQADVLDLISEFAATVRG